MDRLINGGTGYSLCIPHFRISRNAEYWQESRYEIKRLFLFMATRAQHQWLNFVDQKKIDLGSGDRSIVKDGAYNAAFHITIPKEQAL